MLLQYHRFVSSLLLLRYILFLWVLLNDTASCCCITTALSKCHIKACHFVIQLHIWSMVRCENQVSNVKFLHTAALITTYYAYSVLPVFHNAPIHVLQNIIVEEYKCFVVNNTRTECSFLIKYRHFDFDFNSWYSAWVSFPVWYFLVL
jgi:hypothetical protein